MGSSRHTFLVRAKNIRQARIRATKKIDRDYRTPLTESVIIRELRWDKRYERIGGERTYVVEIERDV